VPGALPYAHFARPAGDQFYVADAKAANPLLTPEIAMTEVDRTADGADHTDYDLSCQPSELT
jgi:hypothetical protein